MRYKLIVTLILYTLFPVHAQLKSLKLVDTCVYKAECLQNFLNYKIHLVGEIHYKPVNQEIRFLYLRLLNSLGIYPKYIVREEGEAASFIRNLYFETGNEFYLNQVSVMNPYRAEDIELKKYYLSLPEEKRFQFKGMDVEYSFYKPHFVIAYIFRKHRASLIDSLNFFDKEQLCALTESILEKQDPYTWDKKLVRKDVDSLIGWFRCEDSVLLKNTLGQEDYSLIKRILRGYVLGKGDLRLANSRSGEYNIEREKFLCDNLYQLYLRDTSSYYYGQFGMAHVILSAEDTIKRALNNPSFVSQLYSSAFYSSTNGNIQSTIIYYRKYQRIYVFLKKRKKELEQKYKLLSEGQSVLVPVKRKESEYMLLLFKQ